jgi:hypothetical protein
VPLSRAVTDCLPSAHAARILPDLCVSCINARHIIFSADFRHKIRGNSMDETELAIDHLIKAIAAARQRAGAMHDSAPRRRLIEAIKSAERAKELLGRNLTNESDEFTKQMDSRQFVPYRAEYIL